ncbi:MAG: acyl-CoA dehydrogenase family protein [Solirubrobacterales bacterium]|nr:acyl-CoA dehydrogenase family protein [Solirubrobacterales bacterium]MCB8971377.1 acyl-CoA dehydrogenase family protein [Thermoleophilales bacterium]MCO5328042.1 acyl-CoA dehydrogenase family protein [Solirubrobacterales bacterium]
MTLAQQGTQVALRGLNRLAQLDLIDKTGLRGLTERLVYHSTRGGFRAANAAGRSFAAVQKLGKPARQPRAKRSGGFDVTPDEEQLMMQEAVGDFAQERLRTAAQDADAACAAPPELLAQSAELGIATLGVPEELGGAFSERSAVTSALITEALAGGDMGIAFAALAPAGVSTAIGLWGDAEQQSAYLPAFTGEDVPAAALAVHEPGALFDPFELSTKARRDGDDIVIDGLKALVPRAADAELFVVAADLEGTGPVLLIVEAKSEGLLTKAEPIVGVRAAATGELKLEGVRVPGSALLAEGSPDVYAECIRLSRIAWCAMAVGTAQGALDFLIPYVNERKAFGEPISHRQAVAFNMSNIAIEVEGMRLTTYRAASLADQGKDFTRESAIARRLCADKGFRIGSDAVQLLGGHGYVKEYPVERWYRDLRAAGVIEGGLLV